MDVKHVIKGILFATLTIGSASVKAKECDTLDDFYSSKGCTVKTKSRHTVISNIGAPQVNVTVFKNTVGTKNPDRIFHVIGPYEVPNVEPVGLSAMEDQIQQIRALGIDVAYYDFSQSNNDLVQNKALALSEALKKLDNARGKTTPSIMLGLSMGGVVARYALTTMEKEDYEHGVTYYVSFDSPHQGAHISRSLQYIPLFFKTGSTEPLTTTTTRSTSSAHFSMW